MTKTRAKLVEFLGNSFRNKTLMMEEIADLLIENGWLELDEPREWWLVPSMSGWRVFDKKEVAAHFANETQKGPVLDFYHVREVIPNENK